MAVAERGQMMFFRTGKKLVVPLEDAQPSIESLVQRVDMTRWNALRDHWVGTYVTAVGKGERPDRLVRHAYNYAKYFELEQWIRYHLQCTAHLRLASPPRPLRILDIGCGSAIFPFLCNAMGHAAEGLDIESPMYLAMAEILGVRVEPYTVRPLEPLPATVQGFDLFTAISIKFDREDFGTNRVVPWSVEEWQFFLTDLASRLNPNGRIYIKPNLDKGAIDGFADAAISDYLRSISEEVAAPLAYIIRKETLVAPSAGKGKAKGG